MSTNVTRARSDPAKLIRAVAVMIWISEVSRKVEADILQCGPERGRIRETAEREQAALGESR
jgi:hypothetical protein